jgi:putative DNA primase/helicase
MDARDLFKTAIADAGLTPPDEIIADGCIHRFCPDDSNKKSGFYLFHTDNLPAGHFGCWKNGISETWCSKAHTAMDSTEKDLYKRKMEAFKEAREFARKQIIIECIEWCTEHYSNSTEATNNHPYLEAKGVNAYGLKQLGTELMIPLHDTIGNIRGMQFIQPDGTKNFKTGTDKNSHFFLVGSIDSHPLLICEGYATGASLHQATGYAVVVAFDAGNLKPVASVLRNKYPNLCIVICGDNDQWGKVNTGKIKATEAATSVGGLLAIPDFSGVDGKPTDFNDLHKMEGLDAVRQQIDTVAKMSSFSTTAVVAEITSTDTISRDSEPLSLIRSLQPNVSFPVEALPLIICNAVQRAHDVIQAPLSMVCQSFLAAATLVVQPYADLEIDGRRIPLSNNFITVGISGERKSSVDQLATGPIKDRQKNAANEHYKSKKIFDAKHAAWENATKLALKEEDQYKIQELLECAGDEPKHVQPFYLIEEPTFEGLTRAFAEGRFTLGLFSDEAGRFLGGSAMSKDNKTKTVTGLSKLWDGNPIDRTRGGDGLSILYGRRFSMHLMLQPVLSSELFGNSMISGQGFLSRCLCCYPESTIGNRVYSDANLLMDPAINEYNFRMNSILSKALPLNEEQIMGLQPTCITMEGEAKAKWIEFANEVEVRQRDGGDLRQIRGFASKAAEHAARISGVLAVFEDTDTRVVGFEAICSGITILQYYLKEALRLFHASSTDPDLINAQAVYDWGMQQQDGIVALADLYQLGPNAIRDKKTSLRMMGILVDQHLARKIEGGAVVNRKRRMDVWQLRE